jgi:hypothetical protein
MPLSTQVALLFILAIPVACISWTVTHEEVFREPRSYCVRKSRSSRTLLVRKFFYLLTCEYCFSHYVTILVLAITGFRMVFDDWRGFFISFFSVVWVANIYMSLYILLRTDIKKEKTIIKEKEQELNQ